MILDCPEAVDEALTDLYGDDSFLESPEYIGASARYGETVEWMGVAVVAEGTPCFTDTSTASCSVDGACP